jgi:hypothetical protein
VYGYPVPYWGSGYRTDGLLTWLDQRSSGSANSTPYSVIIRYLLGTEHLLSDFHSLCAYQVAIMLVTSTLSRFNIASLPNHYLSFCFPSFFKVSRTLPHSAFLSSALISKDAMAMFSWVEFSLACSRNAGLLACELTCGTSLSLFIFAS